MRHGQSVQKASPLAGTLIGLALIAPLVLRPDALQVLSEFGWNFGLRGRAEWLPLQVATGCAVFLSAVLHRETKSGLLPLAGVWLACAVSDLLLAFALCLVFVHSL